MLPVLRKAVESEEEVLKMRERCEKALKECEYKMRNAYGSLRMFRVLYSVRRLMRCSCVRLKLLINMGKV